MSLTQPYSMPGRRAKRTRWSILATTMLAVAGIGFAPVAVARDGRNASNWVATWSASPQSASSPAELNGVTIRQIARVSIGGQQVRVRLSNAFGSGSLEIGAARVARRSAGASIVAGTDRVLTFNGSPTTTIPAGSVVVSDPVNLKVPDLDELAISLYFSGNAVAATEHSLGLQTTYVSAAGNFSGANDLPTASTSQAYYFLTGVEVVASRQSTAIVTLGDSITDGLNSTVDANKRWPNHLAERLRAQKSTRKVAVLNAGISGNRLLRDIQGTNASARLDRDVLVQSGARYLIVLVGINDIGYPGAVTADEIIAGHRQLIARAKAMGFKVYGGTLTPFKAFLPGIYFTADGEATRQAVNQWIRTSRAYDAVIDFDKAIRDPSDPTVMRAAYDSGDNLHPNDAGYKAMADAVNLSLFKDVARKPIVVKP